MAKALKGIQAMLPSVLFYVVDVKEVTETRDIIFL